MSKESFPALSPLHYDEDGVIIGHELVPMDHPSEGVFWCRVCRGHPSDPGQQPGWVDDKEQYRTISIAGCIRDESVPCGWRNRRAEKAEKQVVELLNALTRLRNNAQHIFQQCRVRDWEETLTEADTAITNAKKGDKHELSD